MLKAIVGSYISFMLIAIVRWGSAQKGSFPNMKFGPDVDVGVIRVTFSFPFNLSSARLKNVFDFMRLG